ncbi:hypothetical protein BC828DRAFT_385096 [Blastocladiella britannica]|nr:hypothetical protein BC828DRAFT_385096 [Blastocladiella britannica]
MSSRQRPPSPSPSLESSSSSVTVTPPFPAVPSPPALALALDSSKYYWTRAFTTAPLTTARLLVSSVRLCDSHRDARLFAISWVYFSACSLVTCAANSLADRWNPNNALPVADRTVLMDSGMEWLGTLYRDRAAGPPDLSDWFVRLCAVLILLRAALSGRRAATVLRRSCFVGGTLYLLRAPTVLMTVLPNPLVNCTSEPHPNLLYDTVLLFLQRRSSCGDVFFSGHTIVFGTCALLWAHYSPRPTVLSMSAVGASIAAIASLVATQYHYSIDVWAAALLLIGVWYGFHWTAEGKVGRNSAMGRLVRWADGDLMARAAVCKRVLHSSSGSAVLSQRLCDLDGGCDGMDSVCAPCAAWWAGVSAPTPSVASPVGTDSDVDVSRDTCYDPVSGHDGNDDDDNDDETAAAERGDCLPPLHLLHNTPPLAVGATAPMSMGRRIANNRQRSRIFNSYGTSSGSPLSWAFNGNSVTSSTLSTGPSVRSTGGGRGVRPMASSMVEPSTVGGPGPGSWLTVPFSSSSYGTMEPHAHPSSIGTTYRLATSSLYPPVIPPDARIATVSASPIAFVPTSSLTSSASSSSGSASAVMVGTAAVSPAALTTGGDRDALLRRGEHHHSHTHQAASTSPIPGSFAFHSHHHSRVVNDGHLAHDR